MSTPPVTPSLGEEKAQSRLAALLDAFDPKLHDGEAMVFAPVGREFGSPTYDESDFGRGDAEAQ